MIPASAALAILLAAGGCATHELAQELQSTVPVLLRFLPPERGGPTVFPEASPSGVLDLSGPCVSLHSRPGESEILISSDHASVGRDGHGHFLRYAGRRFRHGAWVKGGGGHFDRLPAGPLGGPVPDQCSNGPFLVLVDIRAFDPSNVPPPKSPPPPPVD